MPDLVKDLSSGASFPNELRPQLPQQEIQVRVEWTCGSVLSLA